MKFTLRNNVWTMRRHQTFHEASAPKAVSASVPDFKQEHYFMCDMFVTYDDGSVKKFKSRVLQNRITQNWVVDGMHHMVDVSE